MYHIYVVTTHPRNVAQLVKEVLARHDIIVHDPHVPVAQKGARAHGGGGLLEHTSYGVGVREICPPLPSISSTTGRAWELSLLV